MMAYEHWFCERCDKESTVRYSKHSDAYTVRNMIDLHHARKSFNCANENGLSFVRIGNRPTEKRR